MDDLSTVVKGTIDHQLVPCFWELLKKFSSHWSCIWQKIKAKKPQFCSFIKSKQFGIVLDVLHLLAQILLLLYIIIRENRRSDAEL